MYKSINSSKYPVIYDSLNHHRLVVFPLGTLWPGPVAVRKNQVTIIVTHIVSISNYVIQFDFYLFVKCGFFWLS